MEPQLNYVAFLNCLFVRIMRSPIIIVFVWTFVSAPIICTTSQPSHDSLVPPTHAADNACPVDMVHAPIYTAGPQRRQCSYF